MYVRVQQAKRDGDVETLVEALQDDVEGHLAARYLGDLRAVAAIPALMPLLNSGDPHQRASSARALGLMDASISCSRLSEVARTDAVPWVRACATEAVGRLSDHGRVDLLVEALDDKDIRVRRVAVVGLMNAGRPESIPALREARKREHVYSRRIYSKAIRRLNRH